MDEIVGTCDCLLDVDLTARSVSRFSVPPEDHARYLGGKGLALKLLYDRVSPGADPLGGDNIVAVMTGPLTGTGAPCSGRFAAVTRSPLTGLFCSSSCGGPFGLALKTAGYDGMLLRGRSYAPVVVEILDDDVLFRDASHLWGLDTVETQNRLEPGKKDGALVIGPAGENIVRFANVASGHRFLGRGGLGAVFGAKGIKAVLARGGRYRIVPARPRAFAATGEEAVRRIQANRFTADLYRNFGTNANTRPCNAAGLLPIRNFRQGSHSETAAISGEAMRDRYETRHSTCKPCTILCGHRGTYPGGARRSIPEYESVHLLGSNLGIFDPDRIAAFNDRCSRLGMDTISTGATLAFAMEAAERGCWETGLRFGSAEGIEEMIADIAHRRGIGDDLAEGTRRLSRKVGGEDLAMHVKGLELAAYDPRGSWGQGLAYAVANRGGCHLSAYMVSLEILTGLLHPFRTGAKAEFVRFLESLTCGINSLQTCQFTLYAYLLEAPLTKYTPRFLLAFLMQHFPKIALRLTFFRPYPRLWAAATGKRMSSAGFLAAGDRIHVLERWMNTREGVSRSDDTLPDRLLRQPREDDATGRTVPLEEMLEGYYRLRGYDRNGIPTRRTLRKLGIETAGGRTFRSVGLRCRQQRAPGLPRMEHGYLAVMLWFMGRAIQAASRVDPEVRQEVKELPENFRFSLEVIPGGPALVVEKTPGGGLAYIGWRTAGRRIDLRIRIKGVAAAMLLFTFRESTAESAARNRLLVEGRLEGACAAVRIIDVVEVYLLPRFLARRAVKRYPEWPWVRKWWGRVRIYIRALLGR